MNNPVLNEDRIVAAFAGTGKTCLGARRGFMDLDSSSFSWIFCGGDAEKVRNPDFPNNYIECIRKNLGIAGMHHVLVSSNPRVCEALSAHALPYTLAYPRRDILDEYVTRYTDRGSSEEFIETVVRTWDTLHDELDALTPTRRIIMQKGEYLSTYFDKS